MTKYREILRLTSLGLSQRSIMASCNVAQKTVIYDILDSRAKYSLAHHFSNISRDERLRVKYITIDMWEPYRDLAEAYFPKTIKNLADHHFLSSTNTKV